ncbi:DUF6968 family protein [Falsiroseomonas sp.]|uniref:DUF6968 family protein n=1 Tax=Falsiroseomonas sp. TaxID=2870721 RepID=UPI003F706967
MAQRPAKARPAKDTRPGSLLTVRLEVDGMPRGRVALGIPFVEEDRTTWRCRYAITGLSETHRRYCCGVDAVQALILTLDLIPVLLEATEEAKQGLLTRLGEGAPWGFGRGLHDLDREPDPGVVP